MVGPLPRRPGHVARQNQLPGRQPHHSRQLVALRLLPATVLLADPGVPGDDPDRAGGCCLMGCSQWGHSSVCFHDVLSRLTGAIAMVRVVGLGTKGAWDDGGGVGGGGERPTQRWPVGPENGWRSPLAKWRRSKLAQAVQRLGAPGSVLKLPAPEWGAMLLLQTQQLAAAGWRGVVREGKLP